ncbi:MAG: hypothetical protein O3B86_19800, partial [Planctomycetota bacterium]|nr:hypothetical protein [Planctomycetota bacterium]
CGESRTSAVGKSVARKRSEVDVLLEVSHRSSSLALHESRMQTTECDVNKQRGELTAQPS